MYDFSLSLLGASTESFCREIVQCCHGCSLSSVAREYDSAYTTLERWFYEYVPDEIVEEEVTVVSADEFATALAQLKGTITTVVSDFAPAAKAIRSVFPDATHILDRFHFVQFFIEAIRRRRRYLGESKKHSHVRTIDRCLSIAATALTEEERSAARWTTE